MIINRPEVITYTLVNSLGHTTNQTLEELPGKVHWMYVITEGVGSYITYPGMSLKALSAQRRYLIARGDIILDAGTLEPQF